VCYIYLFIVYFLRGGKGEGNSERETKKKEGRTKMVKVILFHLFNGQQVVGIDEEPLAITHASTTILAATKAGKAPPDLLDCLII
jgi:hypothetical protein